MQSDLRFRPLGKGHEGTASSMSAKGNPPRTGSPRRWARTWSWSDGVATARSPACFWGRFRNTLCGGPRYQCWSRLAAFSRSVGRSSQGNREKESRSG